MNAVACAQVILADAILAATSENLGEGWLVPLEWATVGGFLARKVVERCLRTRLHGRRRQPPLLPSTRQ